MNGWTRIWMVISLLATGAVLAFTTHAWYVDIPARGMYSREMAEQFDNNACRILRPEVQQLRDEAGMWRLIGDKPECVGFISFGYRNRHSWDWIKSAEDYSKYEANQQYRRDLYFRQSWLLALPATITFVGLWLAYFTLRPVVRWISRGFGPSPAKRRTRRSRPRKSHSAPAGDGTCCASAENWTRLATSPDIKMRTLVLLPRSFCAVRRPLNWRQRNPTATHNREPRRRSEVAVRIRAL